MRLAAGRRMPEKWSTKKKLGFPVPTRVWLKEEKYIGTIRNEFRSKTAEEFFHTGLLIKLLEDHVSDKADNSRKIWTIYTFLIWYKVYFEEAA
jgi:asparagine synthase (glutamine-hydrolysing)